MSRTNRKHTRAIERHRRNKGPELLSRVSDELVKKNATEIAAALLTATTEHHAVAAANLLVNLAESATYEENAKLYQGALSLAEKWSKEAPFVRVEIVDNAPELAQSRQQLQLGDGSDGNNEDDVIDGEIVAADESSGGSNDAEARADARGD